MLYEKIVGDRVQEYNRTPYQLFKRSFDLFLALVLIIPAATIVMLCYVFIKLETRGPAFFTQKRPGYKGKLFKIYKLRTMRVETDVDGAPLSNIERITRMGSIIRRLSLDELPQLYNVIKGEMSFIGPRPLLTEYLPLYSAEQMRRHDVRPGISGWAQVNGRNELSWEDKFIHDVFYVDNLSFSLDLKILWMTIMKVLKRQGINADVKSTMVKFTGKK